jgi:hypothetical protein
MPDRDLKHRKPYAYKRMRKVEEFLTKFAHAHCTVEAKHFFAPTPGGKVDFRNAHAAPRSDQTNNKQTSNKVAVNV